MSYQGPLFLQGSKYASDSAGPPAASVTTIATKQHITASEMAADSQHADLQLAVVQREALKDQVKQHTATFSKSVSSAMANSQQLSNLLRQSVVRADPASGESALKAIDSLCLELDALFEAAKNTQMVLPQLMEKQADNLRFFHNSMVQTAFKDVQHELDLQHKKVSIQHDIILDHQQAFRDYKERTESKLKALSGLEERVSRLTLDKGLLKTELDNYLRQLEEVRAVQAENNKTTLDLQKELQTAEMSTHELASANEILKRAVNDLHDNAKQGGDRKLSGNDQAAEHKEAAAKLKVLEEENEGLRTTIADLKKTQAGGNESDGTAQGGDTVKLLQDKLRVFETRQVELVKELSTLEQWKVLGERTYKQYKDILSKYKEAEKMAQASLRKDEEIMQLKEALQAAKAAGKAPTNGSTGDTSAMYWKGKYDSLLASLE